MDKKCYVPERLQDRIQRSITITDRVEGHHAYENAPDEVAFLRRSHRHMFHIEVEISVEHDDRELEFFMVKMDWERHIRPFVFMLDNVGSCEQIAERILAGFIQAYGEHRIYAVKVAEDGENWGTVYYNAS